MSRGARFENAASAEAPEPVDTTVGVASLDTLDDAERYALRKRITETESLEVWRALDRRSGRELILKLCVSDDAAVRTQFVRETCIQAQLEHPSIVPVYDFGLRADGREFATAQRVTGMTLRAVLDGLAKNDAAIVKALARERLLGTFHQLCLVADFMHSRGVIHRNLLAENAVIGDFGELYVMGWGLASDVDVDRRTDIYALGAILFEILTHRRLHESNTYAELRRSTELGAEARPTLGTPNLDVPLELEEACVKATALDPALRYATSRELADVVERALEQDRDAANRRLLARGHAELAERLAVHALVATSDANEHRRRALGEAGRALALDPESPGARRALTTLLTEPPDELPPEARQALDAEEAERARAVGRFGALVYVMFTLAALSAFLFGIKGVVAFGLLLGSLFAAVIACLLVARGEEPRPLYRLAILATSSVAVVFASALYGALILVPALAAANTQGLSAGMLRKWRTLVLLLGCAMVTVPFALERLGLVPAAYIFDVDSMRVLPVMIELPEPQVRIALLVVGVMAIFFPTLLIWRNTSERDALRERLYHKTWQLARLLPSEARAKLFGDPRVLAIPAAARSRS